METKINLCTNCIFYPDDCETDYTDITYDADDCVIACPNSIPHW